jgi:hypothetical protein
MLFCAQYPRRDKTICTLQSVFAHLLVSYVSDSHCLIASSYLIEFAPTPRSGPLVADRREPGVGGGVPPTNAEHDTARDGDISARNRTMAGALPIENEVHLLPDHPQVERKAPT